MFPANNNSPPRMWNRSLELNLVQSEEKDEDVNAGLIARIGSPERNPEEPSPVKRGRVVIDLTGSDDNDDGEVQMFTTSKRTQHVAGKYYEGSDEEDFKPQGKSKKSKNKRDRSDLSDSDDFSSKHKEFNRSQDFDKGYVLLNKFLRSRSYDRACEISIELYNAFEPDPEKRMIILKKFEEILSLGQKAIGNIFYSWVLSVITWHTEQGEVNWRSNRLSELIKNYKESAVLGCYFARYNLANLLARLEDFDEAVEHYLLYVKECPEPWQAYAALGAFYEKGWEGQPVDLVKAEYYYNQGHLAGCARSTCNLARLKQEKKELSFADKKEVCELYRISGEHGFADGWYNLGVLYMDGWLGKKDFREAENCFRQAHQLNPTDETNATAVGEAILKNEQDITLERSHEAIQFFEEAIQLRSHEAAYRRGVLYMNGGKFIEKNEELAIKDFELLESFNCSEEYSFVDGLFLLAKLYLKVKSDDPLSLLDRTIVILNNAERLCSEWPNWKNAGVRRDIHQARDPIIQLLIQARIRRVALLLEKCQKSEQNERNRILFRALYDCNHARDENKGFTPQILIESHRFILAELIQLNLQFAENPESVSETKDISPLNKEEKIKKSISFEGENIDDTASQNESKIFLEKANKYHKELKKVNGATPQFMGSITIQLGRVLVKVAKGEKDLDARLAFLRQARDLFIAFEKNYMPQLKEIYTLFYQAYLEAGMHCINEARKAQFFAKAYEYFDKTK